MSNADFEEKRRSDRIRMVLPIRVIGKTGRGTNLQEYTKTVEVGHYGIKFGLKSSLRPRQRIRIQNVRKQTEAPFRVVGQIPGPDAAVRFWGAECLDPSPDFWGINFPPVEQRQDATTRILLQCRKCKTQAVSYLSDLETEAFALTKRAVLFCDTCRRWTRWLTPQPGPEAGTPRSILPAKEVEKRANRRLSLDMVACVQSHKENEEVVKCLDISKGGLAVLSKKSYSKDSFLKVAFPYTEGGGNIFILARVTRVLTTEEPGVFLYGLQFLHGTFPEAKGLGRAVSNHEEPPARPVELFAHLPIQKVLSWIGGAALIALVIGAIWLFLRPDGSTPEVAKPSRTEQTLPKNRTPAGETITRALPWSYRLKKPLTFGHNKSELLSSVIFSPNGRLLASGNLDGTINLWDLAKGEARLRLTGHKAGVHSVAFSPDGRLLASGSVDTTIKLWDTGGGALKQTLRAHKAGVWSLAFDPKGALLGSGSGDKTIKLWDVKSGELEKTLRGHERIVQSVAFSPDGRLLASGSSDRTIKLWDAASGEVKQTLRGHERIVQSVAFSPDGRLLASGSSDRTIKLWDVKSGELKKTLTAHENTVFSVSFSGDGRLLASGSRDDTIKLWEHGQ